MVRSAIARARGWVSAAASAAAPKRRERTEARPRRKPRPTNRLATGLIAGLALAVAAPTAAFAASAGCNALNGFSGTYTIDAAGNGTDNWAPGAANGEVVTYSWSGNTKGAYVYVVYSQNNGSTYAGLIDATAVSGSGSFTTSGTGGANDFYEVGVQNYSIATNVPDAGKNNSSLNITVSCAAAPPAPVASSFTYGSIVAYNDGGNLPTNLSLAFAVTNNPTNFAVGSSTTAQGGSVSVDSAGSATYVPPVGFRGNDSFTYTATNAGGTSAPATVTISVGAPTFAIASALPNGVTGVAYSQQASLTGGKGPYSTFSASGLPSGLSMNASGLITGTPTQTGTFNLNITATDSSTGTGPYTGTAAATLTVVSGADLQASWQGGGSSVAAGQTAALTAQVTNAGTGPAASVSAQFVLPSQVTFSGVTTPAGWTCITPAVGGTGTVTCTKPSVAAGAFEMFTLTVGAPASASPATTSVPLNVTSTTETESASKSLTVLAPDMQASLTGPASVNRGQTATLTLTMSNAGTAATPHASWSTTLPTGLTFTSLSMPAGWSCITPVAGAGGSVSCGQPSGIAVGANQVFSLVAGVGAAAASTTTVNVSALTTYESEAPSVSFSVTEAAPTVTSISPTAGPTSGGASVVITGTGFSSANPTGAVKFGATNATYTINSNTQITATSPANSAGTYDITVTTTGGTSATSAADQYTYVAAPTVTSISPIAGPTGGGATVVITGTGFAAANPTGAVKFGATNATYTINSNTQITAISPANSAGTYDVTVATPGGTSATSAADQYTYVAAPTVTSVSPTAGPTGGGTTVTITGAGFAAANPTGAVKFGATNATYTINSNTQITATSPANSAGTYDVTVTTTGGTSATSAADQYTYLGAPSLTAVTAPRGPSAGGTVVVLQGADLAAATTVTWGGSSIPFSVISDNQIQVTTPAGAVGTAASVTVTTPGGTSGSVQFAYVDTPTVVGLTPAEGPISGGTNVVIHGTNLASASDVTLGGDPVPFTVISDNAIQITTPAGAAGAADVVVSVPYVGTSVPNASARFTYLAAPAVTSVTPNTGSTLGGATVTIGGSNFTGATAVSFGATPATSFTVLSSTSISAVVPPGNAGMSDVRVSTAGGASAVTLWDRYTYFEPATVTSISPATGPSAGGATVVISGLNFYTASAVTFGGTAATSFTIDSNDQITATAPAGTGTVDVRVTNLGGTSAASAADQYTYVAAPTVSSISPATGPATGGTTVVISGANLSGASGVSFGATAASGYTINSATMITATAPAGTGVVDVRVTTVGGTSPTSGADQFTYVGAPTASGLSANVGYETPTAVDLSGSISGVHSSISVASAPAHGTTSISGDVVTYTPAAGYYGADSFTYTASGLGGTSAPATVSLTVATPAAPTAADKPGVAVAYDSIGLAIDLSGSIGGVHGSIAVASAPAHGTTSVAGDVVTYTPTAGYYGADSFTYTASGPGGTSAPATVSLTVATPAAPTVADKPGVAVGYESTGVAIDLSGSITGVHAGVAVGTAPAHGTTSVAGDVVTYTPAAGYFGADSFTYTATGPGGTSAAATVSLTVATPAAPTVAAASSNVGFEAAQAIDLSASITGVHGSIAVASGPAHGTASVSGDVVTYTPAAGYFGADSFTYTATGPGGTSAPATVSLTVATPPPPAPAPQPGPAQVVAGADVGVTITNTGGLATSVQITTPPAHGTVRVDTVAAPAAMTARAAAPPAGSFVLTYVPNPGYSGPDSFAYALVGPGGTSQPQQVQVTVLPSVTLEPIEVSTLQGVPVQVDVTAGASGGPYTGAAVISVGPSASGTASFAQVGASRVMTFTPADDFTGVAVVTYTVSNANSTSAPSTVTVTVEARPNPALDADVRGLIGAQVQAAQRFVDTQVQNFSQRNEQLHGASDQEGPRRHALNLSFGFGDYAGGRPEDPASELRRREMPERPFADQARKLDELALAAADADASSPGGLGPIGGGKVALWSAGSIDFGQRHADAGGSKLKFTTSGVSLGADIEVADGLFVGVGAGYGYDATDIGSEGTRNASRSYMGAVYGSWRIAPQLYLDGVAGLGELSFDSRRIAANDSTVIGRRDGSQAFGSLSLAYDHQDGPLTVSSYGRLTVSKAELDAFTETGDPVFALAYDAQDVDASFGTLGVRGQWNHAMEDGSFTPRVRAEWRRQLSGADAALVRYADFLTGPSYQVDPLAQSTNMLLLGVGGDWRWDEGVALSLDYEGQVGDETLSHRVTLKVSTRF